MYRKILLILTVALISAGGCFANVMPIKLEEMIKNSDRIVVGKVTNVESFKGKKYAEVQVTQTLKGNSNMSRIYYSAFPTWICDASDAEVGETALYFLDISKTKGASAAKLPKRLAAFLQGEPLYSLEYSGRGRLFPRSIEGQDYLMVVEGDDVIFPKQLEIARRDNNYPSVGFVRLADVFSFIKTNIYN